MLSTHTARQNLNDIKRRFVSFKFGALPNPPAPNLNDIKRRLVSFKFWRSPAGLPDLIYDRSRSFWKGLVACLPHRLSCRPSEPPPVAHRLLANSPGRERRPTGARPGALISSVTRRAINTRLNRSLRPLPPDGNRPPRVRGPLRPRVVATSPGRERLQLASETGPPQP